MNKIGKKIYDKCINSIIYTNNSLFITFYNIL